MLKLQFVVPPGPSNVHKNEVLKTDTYAPNQVKHYSARSHNASHHTKRWRDDIKFAVKKANTVYKIFMYISGKYAHTRTHTSTHTSSSSSSSSSSSVTSTYSVYSSCSSAGTTHNQKWQLVLCKSIPLSYSDSSKRQAWQVNYWAQVRQGEHDRCIQKFVVHSYNRNLHYETLREPDTSWLKVIPAKNLQNETIAFPAVKKTTTTHNIRCIDLMRIVRFLQRPIPRPLSDRKSVV